MTSERDIELLREAFAASEGTSPSECPAPETIWAAVRGELLPGELRQVVDHTSLCPSCAADWRLAVAFVGESAGVAEPERSAGRFPALVGLLRRSGIVAAAGPTSGRVPAFGRLLRTAGVAAAAALVVAAAGITLVNRQAGPAAPVFREGTSLQVRSLIPEGETLPRDRCVLSWEVEGGALGSTYHVLVGTEDLQIVSEANGLTRPAFQVPGPAISNLPPQSTLRWQVEVTTPGGQHVSSQTFRIRVH